MPSSPVRLHSFFVTALCVWLSATALGQEIYDSQPETIPKQTPAQVLESVKLPEGFRMQVAAAEPDVQQPIALAWDMRGRLWVAENYTYAESSKKFDLSLSDRILILEDTDGDGTFDSRKVFAENLKELTSIEVGNGGIWALASPNLVWIPDENGDDVPDAEPTILLEGFNPNIRHNFANGLRLGPDGWLYGRHGILGSSEVGPPQRAGYSPNQVRPPGGYGFAPPVAVSTAPTKTRLHCGVWRYHPVTHRVEMVCEGTTNPWGMDWDAHGNLFFINTVIGHLWHAIPGAHLQRMYGEDSDPVVYELLPHIADHVHWDEKGEDWRATRNGPPSSGTDAAGGGHAHSGLLIYQADQWPAEYRNELFTLNLHGRRINRDHLERQGAGFVGQHRPDMVFWSDPWFRGLELSTAPDGSVIVLDWSDIGECHDDDGVHRTSGRIYRISYSAKDAAPYTSAQETLRKLAIPSARASTSLGTPVNRTAISDEQAVALIRQPNVWYTRQFLNGLHLKSVYLQDSKKLRELALPPASPRNKDSASENNGPTGVDPFGVDAVTLQLRAMWVLEAADQWTEDQLFALMRRPQHEAIHSWAIRTLAERLPALDEVKRSEGEAELVDLLSAKPIEQISPLVRLHIAALLPKFGNRWKVANILAKSKDLADDRDFSLVLWYGLRTGVPESPMRAAKLALQSQLPKLSELILRRLASEPSGSTEAPSDAHQALSFILADIVQRKDPEKQGATIRGLWESYQGRKSALPPNYWDPLFTQVESHPDVSVREQALLLQAVFRGTVAADQLIAMAFDGSRPEAARRSAIESIGNIDSDEARDALWSLVGDQKLGGVAALALGKKLNAENAQRLVDMYNSVWPPAKSGIVSALGDRPETLSVLLDAIEQKKIPSEGIDASTWRQFTVVADWELLNRARSLNPKLGLDANKHEAITRLEEWLTDGRLAKADASRGRTVWTTSCAQCHKLFGEGGQIGPELTGAQRSNKRYWIENILAPSAVVAESFRITAFRMEDGRVLTGVLLKEDETTVTIQTPNEKLVVDKQEIAEQKKSENSLMPEGLLDQLDDAKRADLFKYLMSPGQVSAQ
jgi:putative membrane-bound dehydrogenase-like protein